MRQRVDQVGVAEPTIQRVGSNRMLVQLPGLQDPTRLRQLLGSTAKMTFHLLANTASGEPLPRGVTMLPDAKSGAQYPVEDRIALDGEHLTDARASFDQRTHQPLVTFRFDSIGARKFSEITSANVGKPFAIVLDGKVLSAPVIREPITGGSGQISGSFTVEDTVTLSALLRAGALPAPLTVIEERTVGPDLGGDVIKMGIYTGIAGFAAVVLFMVALYGSWGMIANFTLLLHLILTFGVLNIIGATLTLPGIAGIILGIGFGVDANILINERIREEAKKGLSAFAALDNGFKRAYSTIVDANVTSLIATSLLFMFGSGPVKGFAVTMFLGTCLSMFTAVSVTRILMAAVVRRQKLKTIKIEPLVRFFPEKTSIAFMKGRYLGIGMSIFLSVASVALFMKPGLNYGIDFKGGIQVEISTSQPADLAQLRSALGGLGVGEVTLQQVGGDNDVLIRVQRQDGGEQAQTAAVDAVKAAVQQLDPGVKFDRDRSRRTEGQWRACAVWRDGCRARGARDAGLHMVAVRVEFRHRRDRHAGARHHQDDRLLRAVPARLQPDGDRGLAHHHRLFGERQGGRLRPNARESQALQEDAAARDHRHEHQPGVRTMHLHLGRDPLFHAADGDLGRKCCRKLRRADGVRRGDRDDFVDLHRSAHPALAR